MYAIINENVHFGVRIMAKLRLDKIIASTGEYSRSEAANLIRMGAVLVNGIPAGSGADKYDPETDEIIVKGVCISYSKYYYVMMNKPAGVLSATDDNRDKTVLDLLPEKYKKIGLFPAGRLDKASEGLMLLTNDGEYAHKVITPNKKVFKKYYVETEGILTEKDCKAVEEGIALKDFTTLPGKMEIISSGENSSAYVYICEGKFHQVRRMLQSLGKPVTYLKRMSIGSLVLDETLHVGEYREMQKEEADKVFLNNSKIG